MLEYGTPYGLANHVAKLQEVRAQVSRNDFLWHKIEATQGRYDWARHDEAVDALLAAGIEPLMVIWGSPLWANGSTDPTYVPPDEPQFTKWLSAYRDFVRVLASRYRGRVRQWELWNEPNIIDWWKPAPNLNAYARWASTMEQEIHTVDPDAQVAYGSVTDVDVAFRREDYSGQDFIKGLYERGISPRVVSLHLYAYQNEPPEAGGPGDGLDTFRDVETVRQVLIDHHASSTPLWITEFSWWAGPNPWNRAYSLTEEQQADYLHRALTLVQNWPFVSRVIWFWDWDREGSPDGAGLYRRDGSLRPVGEVFKAADVSYRR